MGKGSRYRPVDRRKWDRAWVRLERSGKKVVKKVKYSCSCRSEEVDVPESGWVLSGDRVCVNCKSVILTEIFEE